MDDVIIRNYRLEDEAAVEDITYRTGFQGEDLTGRNFFDDRRLWFLMFNYYYARYEPEHYFVAVDASSDAVVGFICGTTDSAAQQRSFQRNVIWRIGTRVFLVTIWRYPRTFVNMLNMGRAMMSSLGDGEATAAIQADYPAHLHIDLLPERQRRGVGTRLMQHFEAHLIRHGAKGVHLQTSNHNRKAVPFYKKLGFAIVAETEIKSHPALDDMKLLTFAKKLR